MSFINTPAFQMIKDSNNRAPYSNCMRSVEQLLQGLESGKIDVISASNPVVLVERKEDFAQLYYFFDRTLGSVDLSSVEWDPIREKISEYNPLYADITVRGDFEYKDSVFERLGLKPFRIYLRMSCKNIKKEYREFLEPQTADVADLDAIQLLMQTEPTFDVMSDHLPDNQELKQLLLERKVLKIEIENKMAGVYIFEDTGIKSYGRTLCVAQEYQDNILGYSLLANYRNRHLNVTTLFYTWVHQENRRSRALQQKHFGYQEDGLKNYVFKK